MSKIKRLTAMLGVGLGLLAPPSMAQSPSVVLFEDPAVLVDRLHYPLLISEERGYRILCASQQDEEAVIRGLGFATVPSQIMNALDPEIVAAAPGDNPVLCPSAADYQIKVFAADQADGLNHYMQFPEEIGSETYTDRIYVPGCTGLVDALNIDLSQALSADPTPFFTGKIHEISCLDGDPIDVAPETFTAWCTKGDRTAEETSAVMAMLDTTPGGVSALDNPAACATADSFLTAVPALNLTGKGVQSVAPVSVLSHLTSLQLANNDISDISALTSLAALTVLDLSGNKLSNVAALAPLTALTRLDLSDNRIEDVRSLSALPLLTSLTLDGNAIGDLSPLQFLSVLTELSLSRNALTDDMLEPLTALGALTSLDLSQNAIASFGHLGEFPSTVEIDLSGNPIVGADGGTFLDQCILHRDAATPYGQTVRAIVEGQGGGTCASVNNALLATTTLDLSNKVIADVRPLGVLTHLTGLNLSNNAISDVTALAGLTGLRTLDLANNAITDIRPVGPLEQLTSFNASGNPVTLDTFLSACIMREHPDTLSDAQTAEVNALLNISGRSGCQAAHNALRQVQSADARNSGLTTVDYFPVMERLHSLQISNNELDDLSPLRRMQGLTRLWADNNQIASFSALSGLTRLQLLAVQGNPVNSLNGVTNFQKLRSIYLSATRVRSVGQLDALPFLETARLRNLNLILGNLREYCVAHRFDPVVLGQDRAFMAALDTAAHAANVDTEDCNAVETWAQDLRNLNFNKKQISSVRPIMFFPDLEQLFLYDNIIRDISPIAQLRRLKKLNLGSNRLTQLPRFNSTGLEQLLLQENQIDRVTSLTNLTRLKSLNLYKNTVRDPTPLLGIPTLAYLDLRDNRIGEIQKATAILPRNPYLKGNPVCQLRIHHPPLNTACTREPMLIFEPVIDLSTVNRRAIEICPGGTCPTITVRPGIVFPGNN